MKCLSAMVLTAGALMLPGCGSHPASASSSQHIVVTHNEPRSGAEAFPGNFTGSVSVTPIFNATEQLPATGASVAFEPNARTTWHAHPAGQTLFVTSGTGWVQEWTGSKIDVKPGDVIWTPPGVKHWHGATATTPMTHVAIQGVVDGKSVDWKEPVTDQQYAR
jgi:quercetin dioxygenase-like cupin family protein